MVKIIRSGQFSEDHQVQTTEIPFNEIPALAAIVYIHGPDVLNISSIYPACSEPDLREAILDMITRGYSIKAEGLLDRVMRAKAVVLAFDTSGNLVGMAAIRRDQRTYRAKIQDTFGVSIDSAYALNWVRGRDEFKSPLFYELAISTALAVLGDVHPPVYSLTTLTEGALYTEALDHNGFALQPEARTGAPLAHLRLHVYAAQSGSQTTSGATAEQDSIRESCLCGDEGASPDMDCAVAVDDD